MLNKRTLLASSALAVLTSVGSAQAGNFYVSINAGANFQGDKSHFGTTTSFPGVGTDTIDPKTGFVFGAAVGVHLDRWLNGLRAELEADYRRNNLDGLWTADSIFFIGDTSGPIDGRLSNFALLANIWYDIDIGSKFVPYVGGGAGWGRAKFEGLLVNDGATFSVENSGFVFQLGGGVNYQIQDGVQLGAGYRYFRGPNVQSNVFVGKNGNIRLPVEGDNDNHAVVLTLTIDTN